MFQADSFIFQASQALLQDYCSTFASISIFIEVCILAFPFFEQCSPFLSLFPLFLLREGQLYFKGLESVWKT